MTTKESFIQKKIDKGIQFLEKKNFSKAIEIFDYLKKKDSTKLVGLFFLGIIQIQKKNNLLAEEYFLKIIRINTNHEDANLNLAFIYFSEKKYDKSIFYLDKVIEINKNNLNAYYHKGLIYFNIKDYENAIKYFEICINLNRNFIYSYLNLGHIYLRVKNFSKAIYNYTKVLEINPNNNTAKFNLSWCYYSILDFNNAFKYYEYRKEKTQTGERLNKIKNKFECEEWLGKNLDNKSILILSEQGIGDNIQFFRYLFWLKEKFNVRITFYVDKKLINLFKNTPFEIVSDLNDVNEADFFQHLLSLPGIYYKEKNKFQKNIPYIKPEVNLEQKWKFKFENYKKPIIALNWQGDQNFAFDSTRSIALSFFKDILKIDTFKFISLQKGFGTEQIELNNFSENLIDLSNEIDVGVNSFEDTIAILVNIDLLITSDTAIAHLAGTLGVKTYLLLEHNPEWRWYIENEFKCFYPNLNIIQQSEPGNWSAVFKNLKEQLKMKANQITA
jgi:tetratricopeptide (TPR) repeat protein